MLLAFPLGIGIGLSLGLVGGGGAMLAVPVLVYVLGQDVHEATTASLVVVAVAALAGGMARPGGAPVCWRAAALFAAPAVAAAAAGASVNAAVGGRLLLALFSVVMAAAAFATWRRAGRGDGATECEQGCPPVAVGRTVAAGLAVGALTGFFGVGGGFVVVPTLALWLGFGMQRAVGTSLVIVSAVSSAALASHLAAGSAPDWGLAAFLAAATAAGSVAGATYASRVPQRLLARGFALVAGAVAASMLGASVLAGAPA